MKKLPEQQRYLRLLTIAGSDSSGGAGIQADLKTFSALGCYGMSVITAVTAQNTRRVESVLPVSPLMVGAQLDAVLDDIGVDAVKIGMLADARIVEIVADRLSAFCCTNIVVDPVLQSTSGDPLSTAETIDAMKAVLFPLASVITPNLPEAELLLKQPVTSVDGMEAVGRGLLEYGSQAILLKGGHLPGHECIDMLFREQEPVQMYSGPRVATRNSHGTGCTLSSALASFLAQGCPLEEAVAQAKSYVSEALQAGTYYCLGQGHGPIHHFCRWWK